MTRKHQKHDYLLSLYHKVDEFLGRESISPKDVPDLIVSFCVVVEKILKIKLYNKNRLLIFDLSFKKDEYDNVISAIALAREDDVPTIKIENVTNRFGIVFKKTITANDREAILSLYRLRNAFIHGYKSDDKVVFDKEDVVKKMGTVWGKISKIAISIFGKENIKNVEPKKKYTEKELEKVLGDEVRKMIDSQQGGAGFVVGVSHQIPSYFPVPMEDSLDTFMKVGVGALQDRANIAAFSPSYGQTSFGVLDDECPRCGKRAFSLNGSFSPFFTKDDESALYKCKFCNLELTKKQYEIAKKIRMGK